MHTNIGIVSMTFVILSQDHKSFLRSLAKRLDALSPLLCLRIAAVVNHLVERHVIDHYAAVPLVQGTYPNVIAEGGQYVMMTDHLKRNLERMAVQGGLDEVMKVVVGIPDAALSAGFDKVVGVVTGTAKGAYKAYDTASKYGDYGKKAWDTGKKTYDLRAALKKTRGDPVDVFISIM